MTLEDLTADEKLALVALLKLVVRADRELSADEVKELNEVARQMGPDEWHATVGQARQRFRRLGYRNIRVQHSDGSWGWPQFGPFDAIIVTAGGAEIPPALLEQLPVGGRLVMPLGGRAQQTLVSVTRTETVFEQVDLEPVVFVPLVGGTH